MLVIGRVGLGNPGKLDTRNRHNIGFMAVDAIAEGRPVRPLSRSASGIDGGRTDRR